MLLLIVYSQINLHVQSHHSDTSLILETLYTNIDGMSQPIKMNHTDFSQSQMYLIILKLYDPNGFWKFLQFYHHLIYIYSSCTKRIMQKRLAFKCCHFNFTMSNDCISKFESTQAKFWVTTCISKLWVSLIKILQLTVKKIWVTYSKRKSLFFKLSISTWN